MYVSSALLFGALVTLTVLAARRDRLFLIAAVLAAAALADGVLWGIVLSVGPAGLGLILIGLACLLSLGEAVGLPAPIARRIRVGIRSRDRDYDGEVSKSIAPFSAEVRRAALVPEAGIAGAPVGLERLARRTRERLDRSVPPSDAWRHLRDGYTAAIVAAMKVLSAGRGAADAYRAYVGAHDPVRVQHALLRDRYRRLVPSSPRWSLVVILLTYVVAGTLAQELLDRAAEFIAPPSVAVGWQPMTISFDPADSWAGDAVSDGGRLYLIDREQIAGFWGVTRIRSSSDGGRTWSAPGAASLTDVPETARPAIAQAPDGSIWTALVRQGPQVATQLLQIGRSTDGGVSWPLLARASVPSVGLVGLPIIVASPAVHLIAYTDGATGQVLIQPLNVSLMPQPQRDGSPSIIGRTTRELYSDANFFDAGLALAAVGRHVVALWRPNDSVVAVALSDDGGVTWRAGSDLSRTAAGPRPHLLAIDGRLVATWVERAGSSGGSVLVLASSTDGGSTWDPPVALSTGFAASEGVLDVSDGLWRVVFTACPGEVGCIVPPRIWYRSSQDGVAWSGPGALSRPESGLSVIGVGATAGRTWALWFRDPTGRAEDRMIEGATR